MINYGFSIGSVMTLSGKHNQLWRIMRITSFLLLWACLHVSASSISQTVTLKVNKKPLAEVLATIKKQTGFRIMYNDRFVSPTMLVSIDVTRQPFEFVLDQLLTPNRLTYHIEGKTIAISRVPLSGLPESKRPVDRYPLQQRTVSGTVTDKSGSPLEGVTVRVKATASATTTDATGYYEIRLPGSENTLVFTILGYEQAETPTGGRSVVNISLQTAVSDLDEVVVVGYGTVRKEDLTGAVGQASINDMQNAPVRSFDEALGGRIAGVTVSSSDGQPGSAINIVVRGNNSITQDNSPLYIVDGFPIENPDNNIINPNDIASIDVLKDASATAIYGARGANGVILITTKKGEEGPPVLSMGGWYGFQKVPETPALLSPYEFVKLQLEIAPGDINSPGSGASFYLKDGKTLESYKDSAAIDWQSLMFREAPMQNYNMAVTGGSKLTKYAISGSILNQDGVIINSDYKRYQGRIVLDQAIGNNLKIGVNANYTYLTQSGISPTYASTTGGSLTSSMMYSVWGYRPFGNALLSEEFDDNINSSNDYRFNPVVNQQNLVRFNNSNNLAANAYAEYMIIPDLKLRITGGINNNIKEAIAFNNLNTSFGSPHLTNRGINGSDNYYRANSWVNENTLTYHKRFNADHSLNLLAGLTAQKATTSSSGLTAIDLPGQATNVSWLRSGTASGIISGASVNTLTSALGRVNYSFQSKYLLTASFRADGSSKFAPENQWSYFPSGAIAWRFSSEKFMEGLNILSEGKLRVSYGVTGNNRVGDFDYLSQYTVSGTGHGYTFGNTNVPGTVPAALGNAKLKWETTSQTDIGLDLGLVNNRINLTIDVYRKKTTDLILNSALPQSYGYSTIFKNIGSVQNQGLEFTFNSTNLKNDRFSWSSNFNIAFNSNKVLSLTENQESMTNLYAPYDNNVRTLPAFIAKIGRSLGLMYGPVWDGVYQYSDFDQTSSGSYVLKNSEPTNGSSRSSVNPGSIKYKDINGDGIVDNRDFTVIGRGLPIHTGGFSNNFTYRGFDMHLFFQWSYGNDILNVNRLVFEGSDKPGLNQFASYADRWTPDNPSNTMYRPRGGGPVQNSFSTRIIEDGSYLRLKTVSLGYSLGNSMIEKWRMRSLRVYVAAQNLYTWTKYSGMDPEVSIYQSVLTPGVDYSAYPRASTLVFGLDVSF